MLDDSRDPLLLAGLLFSIAGEIIAKAAVRELYS